MKPVLIWDNRFADATPAASSTESGAAINLADFRPYTSWKPSALPATLTVDCGSAKSADSLSVFNHNLFSSGITVAVRASTDNFSASDVLVDSFEPTSDDAFVRTFASASYRYWRLSLSGSSAPTLSIAALGMLLEFPKSMPRGFDPLMRKSFQQTNVSEDGLPLGKAIMFEQWSETLSFHNLLSTWVRGTFLPIWKSHLVKNPFLFVFDLTNNPDEIYLVESGDMVNMPHSNSKTYMALSFAIKGVALP